METLDARLLLCIALCLCALCCSADELFIEAEAYSRCEETLIPPFTGSREAASGGRITAVRAPETGEPTWLEYDVTVAGGLYELRLRAGGNDSRQAGAVSIDGGKPAAVLDDPKDALPIGQALPPDAPDRSRILERSFREHLVGAAPLSPGRHRVRLQHAGLEGRSNAFGVDWLKLTRVETSDAPVLEVGDRPDAPEGRSADVPRPLSVRLLTSYRFWGPDEEPRIALVVENRELAQPPTGTLTVEVVSATGEPVVSLADGPLPRLEVGQAVCRRLSLGDAPLPRGAYAVVAKVKLEGGQDLGDRAELVLSDVNTPGWAKRARTQWVGFTTGSDLQQSLARVKAAAGDGINVMVNADVLDFFGNEAISYPFRGRDQDFRDFCAGVHGVGANLLMYHTMVTVSEHFYYEHKGFWGGRKPYYHCTWLSIYPDSPEWNAYQAADFEYSLGKYPMDGIFLDNACATGGPGMRSPSGEEAIAHHQEGLRAAIKRANPTGVLYPNYNTLTPAGLRTVSRAWDAHMLEGQHPVPKQHRSGPAWTVADFVTVARRVGGITGKPFWPLMYAPQQYHKLGIAACGAARGNPAGAIDRQYLKFMDDVEEYLYADDVYPAPESTVKLASPDPDLAATAALRLYPSAGTHDWVIQVVNGTEIDGELAMREVELQLNLPRQDLARPAWVLRPEADAAERTALTNPLKLNVGVWTVIIVGEELLSRIRVSPALIAPVPGESTEIEVGLRPWAGAESAPGLSLVLPDGWQPAAAAAAADGTVRLSLTPPEDAAPGNREVALRVASGARVSNIPLLLRVRPRVELRLAPDHFAATGTTEGATALEVANNTSRTITGEVAVNLPDGWRASPSSATVSLAPGEAIRIPCKVQWPAFEPEGLYDIRDATAKATLSAELPGPPIAQEIPIRLHIPITWLVYCPLGTRPADSVRTGATPEGGFLSDIVFTVNAFPNHEDDARQAVTAAIARQEAGGQRVVLWFRTGGGKGSDQLADSEVQSLIARFMSLGGGVIIQENTLKDSAPNRALLESDICPVSGPYVSTDEPGGDWTMVAPEHPSVARFSRLALDGAPNWRIPVAAQPARVKLTPKPWATVVARNERGDATVVVSDDPARPVAYIAGSLEGAYISDRYGMNEYPEQMAHLLYLYPELARWLSIASLGR